MTVLFRTWLSRSLSLLAIFACTSALADTTVVVPRPYTTNLIDGKPYKGNSSELNLVEGEHQLVIRFEGNYSTKNNVDLVSGEPLVVNFKTNGKEQLTFDLPLIRESAQAKAFLKNQKLHLVDKNTKAIKEANIFELPKKKAYRLAGIIRKNCWRWVKHFSNPLSMKTALCQQVVMCNKLL